MTPEMKEYFAVEDVLRHSREQRESVKGKDTPFRVEFRYRRRMRHYQYFICREDAEMSTDLSAGYGPTGHAHIENPLSRVIQERGPRGGWR